MAHDKNGCSQSLSIPEAGQKDRGLWGQEWCSRSLAKVVLRMRTARDIICRYNWIADYTIIMLAHKIT